jgi:predicted nucleic acid-binding protein
VAHEQTRDVETWVGELIESLLSPSLRFIAEPVIAADPDDDGVLACAVAGKARWIVSGDASARAQAPQANIHPCTKRRAGEVAARTL